LVEEAIGSAGEAIDASGVATGDISVLKGLLAIEVAPNVEEAPKVEVAPDEGKLRAMGTGCDEAKRKSIRDLQKQVRYSLTPVQLDSEMRKYAVPILAAAAFLDYVRSGDEGVLDDSFQKLIDFAVQEASVRIYRKWQWEQEAKGYGTVVWPITEGSYKEKHEAQIKALRDAGGVPMALAKAGDVVCIEEVRTLINRMRKLECLEPDRDVVARMVNKEIEEANRKGIKTTETEACKAGIEACEAAIRARVTDRANGLAEEMRGDLKEELQVRSPEVWRAMKMYFDGQQKGAQRALVRLALERLEAALDAYIAKEFDPEKECEDDLDTRWLWLLDRSDAKCTAGVLLKAAYRPVVDYFWTSGGDKDGKDLAVSVYRNLASQPGLESSLLIFNVGLGGSWVTDSWRNDKNEFWVSRTEGGESGRYVAMTVLDKIGLAIGNGADAESRWEFGLFAGGFLDALVRTTADVGEEKRFWLAGLTGGWTRMSGTDFGIEWHLAAALPYELGEAGDQTGLAIGAAIVVPMYWVLDEEE